MQFSRLCTFVFFSCLLLKSWTDASFYSIDSHTPPFLHRNNDEKGVIQWDTGDVARDVALSDGVTVNYQGRFTNIYTCFKKYNTCR
jgi:hypothetical protein